MSKMLDQLKQIINSENVPAERVSIKYTRMKQQSEKLTNIDLINNVVPIGQGAIDCYPGGFPA